jgi:hypothetical protein
VRARSPGAAKMKLHRLGFLQKAHRREAVVITTSLTSTSQRFQAQRFIQNSSCS